MPLVSQVITHVLKHVISEASDTAPDQTPGLIERAQYVRNALNNLKNDNRNLPMPAILTLMKTSGPPGPNRANYRAACDKERSRPEVNQKPWLQIHGWVQKEEERP